MVRARSMSGDFRRLACLPARLHWAICGDRGMLQQTVRRDAGLKLVARAREATVAAEAVLQPATAAVRARVQIDTRTVARLFDREQRAAHGLAWLATTVEAIRQVTVFAEQAYHADILGEFEELLILIGIGEYIAQIQGGIPMSQGE